MKKALIIIDMQYDNFKDSDMNEAEAREVVDKTNALIAFAKENLISVYIVEHISANADSTMFVSGTRGAMTHDDIDTDGAIKIIKNYPNSFRNTNLQELLEADGVTNLIVSGAMTHMCIDTTVRAGNDMGFDMTLVSDACFTKNLTFEDRVVKAADVQVSYMAALGDGFCKIIDTMDFVK